MNVRGLAIAAGWLLTPVVAWAVSFAGAWIGAKIGVGSTAMFAGVAWLSAGAVVGAVMGAVGWLLLLRVVRRRWVVVGDEQVVEPADGAP